MKFDYEKEPEISIPEPVAYLNGPVLVLRQGKTYDSLKIWTDGSGCEGDWQPDNADKVFFPGDTLTITF